MVELIIHIAARYTPGFPWLCLRPHCLYYKVCIPGLCLFACLYIKPPAQPSDMLAACVVASPPSERRRRPPPPRPIRLSYFHIPRYVCNRQTYAPNFPLERLLFEN